MESSCLQHRFDDKLALLESIRRLNGILFPMPDEFRAPMKPSRKYTASMSLPVLLWFLNRPVGR